MHYLLLTYSTTAVEAGKAKKNKKVGPGGWGEGDVDLKRRLGYKPFLSLRFKSAFSPFLTQICKRSRNSL